MLDLCSLCGLHVRRSESRCPFCGAAELWRAPTVGRLGRSAILALGASVAACGPACPKDDSLTPATQVVTLPDGGTQVQYLPVPVYGTAPPCR
jgi:hypothetical protein